MIIFIFLLSVAAGASTVIARNINSILANKIGLLEGTFFNYITGLTTSIALLLVSGEVIKLFSANYSELPLSAYLGGLVGVMVVSLSNVVTPKISAFYLTLIMFVGQLFSGIVIDYIAIGYVSIGKLLGGVLVVAGLLYNLKVGD